MPTVIIRFPGGRYHATPLGHHVNEGLIEWPPSPWRLLRALVAVGFNKLGWKEIPAIAQGLINKLAQVLPLYQLPPASAAHSRHYMPIGTLDKGREKTTLVFDTWANVGDGVLLIHWPCQLDSEETDLLAKLVSALSYLGRSESWVEAQLTDILAEWNAVPCQDGELRGPGWEQVALMAPIPPGEYELWRERETAPILASIQKPIGKRMTAKQQQRYEEQRRFAVLPFPPDLISCLTKDTAWWKGHGWSLPPGSRRVLYWRRSDALQVGVPPARRRVSARPVQTVLLAITTPSGNRSALPPVTRTLPQAELIHKALIRRLGNGQRVNCPELTGKDELNRPLRDGHGHAHTIPVDLDGDGRLDHIMIYAAMRLSDLAQRAIRALQRTWSKGGAGDLQLAVVGSGDLEMLRRLPPPLSSRLKGILGPPEGAFVWESVTPFVPPKTMDRRRSRCVRAQILAELGYRHLPKPTCVDVDPELTRSLRHFVRRRGRGGVPPKADVGFGVRLYFSEPVRGPLLLGYASHYGLGLFRACTQEPPADRPTVVIVPQRA